MPDSILVDNQPMALAKTRRGLNAIRTLYFFYFAAFGIIVTFLNVYYYDSGLSGVQIGVLSSMMPLVSIVAGPLWGIWSDRIHQVRRLLLIACIGIVAAISGIYLVHSFLLLVFFSMLFALFDSSVLPIMDSTTLLNLGENRDRFGRERVWGSIGFILAVWGVGFVLQRTGSRYFFFFYILMIFGAIVALRWLPNFGTKYKSSIPVSIGKLIHSKEWIIFSASLLMLGFGSFAINGFLGIYIKELGGNEGLVGTAAALAAITELPILFWGEKILKRFGPWRLLLGAFGATSIRLFLYGIMPDAGWVIPISLFHSLTFGVYWIAAVAYVDQMTPDGIKASAQGMFYAVLNISRVAGALLCGYFYDRIGGGNLFSLSALVSLLAILLIWFNKPSKSQKVRVEI